MVPGTETWDTPDFGALPVLPGARAVRQGTAEAFQRIHAIASRLSEQVVDEGLRKDIERIDAIARQEAERLRG